MKPIPAPSGGRICVLTPDMPVTLDRPWREAVRAVRNTPDDYSVWNVGRLYPPIGAGIKNERIVLVYLGPAGGGLAKAVAWAKRYNLKKTDPRHVFSIAEHTSDFQRVLGETTMFVVATKERSFHGYRHVCRVWFGGRGGQCAYFSRVDHVDEGGNWFAFLYK